MVTLEPEGPFLPMSLEVSVSTVVGVVGWKESEATVTAPPSRVVSRPPLEVLRVAQPEVQATKARTAVRRWVGFMGSGELGRWAAGKSFAKLQIKRVRGGP